MPLSSEGKDKIQHEVKDTDLSHTSPHHTLGKGPTQAAPGNHTHTLAQIKEVPGAPDLSPYLLPEEIIAGPGMSVNTTITPGSVVLESNGIDQATADVRYVNVIGDKMTGELLIERTVQQPGLTVSSVGAIDPEIWLDGPTARTRRLGYKTAGATRWTITTTSTAESGADVGSDLAIYRYTDAGVASNALIITRSTSLVTLPGNLAVNGLGSAAESFASGWSGSVSILLRAGWVFLKLSAVKKSTAPATGNPMFTIPSGYRPHASVGQVLIVLASNSAVSGGSDGLKTFMCDLDSTGVVGVAGSYVPAANIPLYGTITYPVA